MAEGDNFVVDFGLMKPTREHKGFEQKYFL
jgi:hypothetical protein